MAGNNINRYVESLSDEEINAILDKEARRISAKGDVPSTAIQKRFAPNNPNQQGISLQRAVVDSQTMLIKHQLESMSAIERNLKFGTDDVKLIMRKAGLITSKDLEVSEGFDNNEDILEMQALEEAFSPDPSLLELETPEINELLDEQLKPRSKKTEDILESEALKEAHDPDSSLYGPEDPGMNEPLDVLLNKGKQE